MSILVASFARPGGSGRSNPLSGVLRGLERMRRRAAERRRVRRDMRALLRLADHQLRDIGLTRGDVLAAFHKARS